MTLFVYNRLGKLLNEPPAASQNPSNLTGCNGNPMREEWKEWVRSEFRLRQHSSTDDEATRTLLVHGKRQLQEMERTILLATNRNTSSPVTPPPASPHHQCPSKNKTNHKPSDTLLSSQNGTTESSNSSTSQNIKRKQDSNL